MLQMLAHTVLKDLNHAGAVLNRRGDVLEVNDTFMAEFVDDRTGADAVPCAELQAALQRMSGRKAGRATGEGEIFERNDRYYRLDVYF